MEEPEDPFDYMKRIYRKWLAEIPRIWLGITCIGVGLFMLLARNGAGLAVLVAGFLIWPHTLPNDPQNMEREYWDSFGMMAGLLILMGCVVWWVW